MTFPSIQTEIDDETLAKMAAFLGEEIPESSEESPFDPEDDSPTETSEVYEQPAPVRRRGRPKAKRDANGNIMRDSFGKPIPDEEQSSSYTPSTKRSYGTRTSNLAPAASLSKREERQVAERISNMLEGGTGVLSLAKPYFQMTKEEAEAIASPLSSYLIRMEPTSKIAREVLDQYDIAAFAIALLAYGVRVYLDFQKERVDTKNVVKESGLTPIRARRSKSPVSEDAGDGAGSIEDNSGAPRYAGQISTPNVEGGGILPRL